jgi:hypothetical protein
MVGNKIISSEIRHETRGSTVPLSFTRVMEEDIEEESKRCKDLQYSQIDSSNIVKMSILPKAIYRFTAIPIILYRNKKNQS